ncbi:hypothetical protein [Jeotgalicoccus marinus]|uniref:YkvI family membrane protein n=1 Tax=Jeotgalicoccus TaxID=227979 RepID=UPI0003F6C392
MNYGKFSLVGAIISGLIVIFATRQVAKVGYRLEAESYDISLNAMFGPIVGRIIDYLLIFFLYGTTIIMIAGGGAAFYDGFGVPTWLGSLIIVLLLFVVLQVKFDSILSILGAVTPLLVITVLVIAGYNILNPSVPFSEVNQHTDIFTTPTRSWWWDAITYGGLIIGNSFSFLTIVGAEADRHKIARRGALYGGVIFSVLLLIMVAGILSNIQEANTVELPTLLMAEQIHPVLMYTMATVMVAVIFNSCVGMLYPLLNRFTAPNSKPYRLLLFILLILGYLFSFVGFADLVNTVYPLFGYIGLFITLALLIRWITNKTSKKKLM